MNKSERMLTAEDFPTFFLDVHGLDPFPWQERLTSQVLKKGNWPSVIDLPTGTGKTAVIDTAVFAMAVQPNSAPRRIVFIVDRRIVVDQAYKRAQRIREKIESAETLILETIKKRLNDISDGETLEVAALRGGIPIENEWAHRPDQPWVMVSTVDQFGSRLLFRGYGVSHGMRPVHAGLAGNDCLVILDEVHLSIPFADTLDRVATWESSILPRRFHVVKMSATPNNQKADRFTIDTTEIESCSELYRRVHASKEAQLISISNPNDLPSKIVKIIKSIPKASPKVRCIGVVVNRVRTARNTHQALIGEGLTSYLVTGRMRPLDRVEIVLKIELVASPDRKRDDDELTVVVATQAIEVGADFDFDALVTECAPIDSLQQRFGRVDRRGVFSESGGLAPIWILGPKSVVESKKPDPIYGVATKATWEELKRMCNDEGLIDVGTQSLRGRNFDRNSYAPKEQAPLLLQTYMDSFVQTRPEPIVQPSVEWFLHGINQQPTNPDISIVWRWDLSPEGIVEVPPRQAEFMQVPIGAAKSWLSMSNEREVDIADVSRLIADNKSESGNQSQQSEWEFKWVRWQGFQKSNKKVERNVGINDIRPGDILIVSPELGGISSGTWNPTSTTEICDLGDEAQFAYKRRVTLRLHPKFIISSIVPPMPSDEETSESPARQRILHWLHQLLEDPKVKERWIKKTVERLCCGFNFTAVQNSDNSDNPIDFEYYILTERHPNSKKPKLDVAVMDSSDESVSMTGTGTSLDQHLRGVGDCAAKFAKNLGLSNELVNDLRLAGLLHDIGKVDTRFQEQMVGGDIVELELRKNKPLAKSLRQVRSVRRYPTGMRHEIASVAMITSNLDILNDANDKDLVLHLVGTHHGWGRPLLPTIVDPKPQKLVYVFNGYKMEVSSNLGESSLTLDMAERFWCLVERYGYYGLAWLESILRLADHRQSAMEAEN